MRSFAGNFCAPVVTNLHHCAKPPAMAMRSSGDLNVDLLVGVLRIASLINRPMRDGVADPEGLSLNELRILMALGGEGEMAGHDLAEVMGMQPMNVSRAFATLSDLGWIEAAGDGQNRRRKPYRLSEAGWAAHRDMLPEVKAVADFLMAGLSSAESKGLSALLAKLGQRLETWKAPRKRPHVARP